VHDGPLHIYPTNSRSKVFYIPNAARAAQHIVADVMTVQDPFEAGLAGLLGRKGLPLHVQIHTDLFAPGFARGLNRARLALARIVLPRAAQVRTVSVHLAEALRIYYPHVPVSVLPIFVDIQKYRAIERRPHPRFNTTLLWVGRFEREKNPALAIHALASARAKGHDVGLVMLGTGQLDKELHELAQALGVGEWVEFAGWQEPAEFLGMADLALVTSQYEGYGRQIVEALAAGVPVLSTDVGVARETGAIVVKERDFENALQHWLATGPRTGEFKNYPYKNFKDYVEKYCADIMKVL